MAVIHGYTDDTAILESVKVMWHNSVVYWSTKDGNNTIHYEEGFKGSKWNQTSLDKHWSWLPRSSKTVFFWTRDWHRRQLKSVMTKAYRAFWTCRGTFG